MPDQVALSYSKFDHIVDSDDEDNESKARDALLIDKKQRHHFERDAELTQRFTAHLREHLKSKYPVAHRKLVARFIAISDRGTERSNVYRYSDMTALIQQRTAELLQRSSITMLCELHKALLEGIKDPENKESAQAAEASERKSSTPRPSRGSQRLMAQAPSSYGNHLPFMATSIRRRWACRAGCPSLSSSTACHRNSSSTYAFAASRLPTSATER